MSSVPLPGTERRQAWGLPFKSQQAEPGQGPPNVCTPMNSFLAPVPSAQPCPRARRVTPMPQDGNSAPKGPEVRTHLLSQTPSGRWCWQWEVVRAAGTGREGGASAWLPEVRRREEEGGTDPGTVSGSERSRASASGSEAHTAG